MSGSFDEAERTRLAAELDRLVPGASELGAVQYVEGLLTALDYDPPHVWAGPDGWLTLGPWELHAWRQRIDELQAVYGRVLANAAEPGDERVLHTHAIEAAYGDPAYGGNQAGRGWERIAFPEPLFPPRRG